MKKVLCMLCMFILFAISVTGCSNNDREAELEKEESSESSEIVVEEPKEYTVTFSLDEEQQIQTITEGECPEVIFTEEEGFHYVWRDADGNEADPYGTAVTEDVTYYGSIVYEIYPASAFLTLDENGFLHPDDLITEEEIQAAFDQLFHGAAAELCQVSGSKLSNVLSALGTVLPKEQIEAAFEGAEEELTKRAFALGVYYLSGIWQESIVFDDQPVIPRDIDLKEDASLICSVNSFTVSEEGDDACDAILQCRWAEGCYFTNGYLYMSLGEQPLRDETVKMVLHFGEDGRYTTGDEELDSLSAAIIKGIIEADPSATEQEWLYAAFKFCRNEGGFGYANVVPGPEPEYGDNDGAWVNVHAKTMFKELKGCCFGFAAAFTVLAQNLGYEAHCISGWAFNAPAGSHSWTLIRHEDDGKFYFTDPQTAYKAYYRPSEREMYGMDGFDEDLYYSDCFAMYWVTPGNEVRETAEETVDGSAEISGEEAAGKSAEESAAAEESQTPSIDVDAAVEQIRSMKGQTVDGVIELYGEPISKEYQGSCMGPGEDGRWVYDGFEVYTYLENEEETVTYAVKQ